MLDTLRDSAPTADVLTHAVKAETQHANESLRLLNEAGLYGVPSGAPPEWTIENLSATQLIAVAQVQATLAQTAATARLADAMERVAAATRIS